MRCGIDSVQLALKLNNFKAFHFKLSQGVAKGSNLNLQFLLKMLTSAKFSFHGTSLMHAAIEECLQNPVRHYL